MPWKTGDNESLVLAIFGGGKIEKESFRDSRKRRRYDQQHYQYTLHMKEWDTDLQAWTGMGLGMGIEVNVN